MRRFCTALACLLAGTAAGQEFIDTGPGALSDDDFYRLVACAAAPGRSCNAPLVRWSDRDAADLTVGFAATRGSFPAGLAREFDRALDVAVWQINAAAPGLTLRRVEKAEEPVISLYMLPVTEGRPIRGTPHPELEGVPIGAAIVQIWWDADRDLTDAAIVLAADIPHDEALPILLEELTQAMGLMTDIRNPWYETRSVFSEDSNSVHKLGEQDRMVLRRHYPG
ncbi:MAG: Protein of unknown function (DUF2927) [Rhodobacteraceae bacterium HLUCCA08]|nr:MAG: Protein of unknown function (DUF2927) [Rhodobacteraceae bacterium HLUCCA08]